MAARNLEIILDCSGSMLSPLGKSTRIGTARQVLRDVLAKIPEDFNVGLRVYANRYSWKDMQHSCTDTQLLLPIQKLDRQRILSTVDNLKPRGDTPLVYSVLQTPADLKAVGGGSVIVITDGQETCHGDPVKAAEAAENGWYSCDPQHRRLHAQRQGEAGRRADDESLRRGDRRALLLCRKR